MIGAAEAAAAISVAGAAKIMGAAGAIGATVISIARPSSGGSNEPGVPEEADSEGHGSDAQNVGPRSNAVLTPMLVGILNNLHWLETHFEPDSEEPSTPAAEVFRSDTQVDISELAHVGRYAWHLALLACSLENWLRRACAKGWRQLCRRCVCLACIIPCPFERKIRLLQARFLDRMQAIDLVQVTFLSHLHSMLFRYSTPVVDRSMQTDADDFMDDVFTQAWEMLNLADAGALLPALHLNVLRQLFRAVTELFAPAHLADITTEPQLAFLQACLDCMGTFTEFFHADGRGLSKQHIRQSVKKLQYYAAGLRSRKFGDERSSSIRLNPLRKSCSSERLNRPRESSSSSISSYEHSHSGHAARSSSRMGLLSTFMHRDMADEQNTFDCLNKCLLRSKLHVTSEQVPSSLCAVSSC